MSLGDLGRRGRGERVCTCACVRVCNVCGRAERAIEAVGPLCRHIVGYIDAQFDEELRDTMKRVGVSTPGELEMKLRKSGSSIETLRSTFRNRHLAQQYLAARADASSEEGRQANALKYYQYLVRAITDPAADVPAGNKVPMPVNRVPRADVEQIVDQADQVRRMLADPRASDNLSRDFAAQWLNLRRVGDVAAHPEVYPSFDDSLLDAFRKETEMFVASTIQENRSVLDLVRADYTFVNERLARHYNIAGVYGSRFRRVTLPDLTQRGGVLGQGSLLATTSYPERTSPVLRGKWLLDNIFGVPVPAPPPGVNTTLPEPTAGNRPPSIRERLAQHRKQPVCASCHSMIDPLGFALENFDAIGGYRLIDESGKPVDAVGNTVDGTKIEGLPGLRALVLTPKERFPMTVAAKLMAYALGRPLEYFDRPAIRKIVRDAEATDYSWSSIAAGIVKSPSFLRRAAPVATN